MEIANEFAITDKLKKISMLVPDEMRGIISDYVAVKITIMRRAYIENLKMETLEH